MKRPSPDFTRADELGAFTRRDLLRTVPALGVATLAPGALVGCGDDIQPMFQHGVASGDPLADGVILWTRVSPGTSGPVGVTWEIAADPTFLQPVASGSAETSTERDLTVKVDVPGLDAGRTYYYRFGAEGSTSPVGRTRTAPRGAVGRARFGVASCSSYAQGYFHAYRALAKRSDLDAVIHLGDYIYESGPGQFGSDREHDPPHEAITLADYRRRHAQYKRDPDLQEVHASTRSSPCGTTTRSPTTPGRMAPRTTSPTPRVRGPSERPPRSAPMPSGCRSAIRRTAAESGASSRGATC